MRGRPIWFFDKMRVMILDTPWLADGTKLRDVRDRPYIARCATKLELLSTTAISLINEASQGNGGGE